MSTSNGGQEYGQLVRRETGEQNTDIRLPDLHSAYLICSFYLIESGMLRASYTFLTHSISESMVAGTAAGEMSFLSRTKRNATVVAERDSVLWKLDILNHDEMAKKEGWAFARRFEQCLLKIACEEVDGSSLSLPPFLDPDWLICIMNPVLMVGRSLFRRLDTTFSLLTDGSSIQGHLFSSL